AAGRQEYVVVVGGGGLDDAADEVQLHAGVVVPGRREDQAERAGPAVGQRPRARVGLIAQIVDDLLDLLPGLLGDRALTAQSVGNGAPRDSGAFGDLADVHSALL